MSSAVIVGLQWGDEGKGKIVDYYAKNMDIVCRFNGGNNAGHTIVTEKAKTILHIIPSGILHENVQCFIGSGTVINPEVFLNEIDLLKKNGISNIEKRVFLSERAPLILSHHILIDELREKERKIGTTKRGIGPAYEDKIARRALRVCDLVDPKTILKKIKLLNSDSFYGTNEKVKEALNNTAKNLSQISEKIKPYIADVSSMLIEAIKHDKKILFEGAQGILLDIDFGTYPFVTSSNTLPQAAAIGMGIPLPKDTKFIGVMKAYTTRVGEGPFPTEIKGEEAERIRKTGSEYGATTGRPRRCGWLDLVSLRYAIEISGVEHIALTKADVLSDFPEIKVCTKYRLNGNTITKLPADTSLLYEVEPIYETFESWDKDISFTHLPKNLINFIKIIENFTNAKISLISFGPRRNEVIEI